MTHVRIGRTASRAAQAALLFLLSLPASGHIKNEASQFPDIEYSGARFDIVMLVGAGIIPETPVFEPDKVLSRRELATWVALSRGLQPGGETPDVRALAEAAREAGLVDPLEGDATLGELGALFFAGAADVDDPGAVPTKAEAAAFIASHLDTAAGQALLDTRGLGAGATGAVEAVETGQGHHGNVYLITVGETTLPMDAHGRVANGPTDLLQWERRVVRRSFVRREGESAVWTYLEAQPPGAASPADPAPPDAAGNFAADTPAESNAAGESPGDTVSPPFDRGLLLGLVAAVIILGFVLFFRRRRS